MLALLMIRYCNMQGKHKNDEHQLWRLKVSIIILHRLISRQTVVQPTLIHPHYIFLQIQIKSQADGCLTNKHHSDRCLEVEGVSQGASLGMHEANGQHSQQWTWT